MDGQVVYWLVLSLIIIHGLSVPILNGLYKLFKVPPICSHPVEIQQLSENEPLPNNSTPGRQRRSIIVNNQFLRPTENEEREEQDVREDDNSGGGTSSMSCCEGIEV